MANHLFLNRYDIEYAPKLGPRTSTFRQVFERLCASGNNDPIIIETGCARQAGNWEGDGQSTQLFDQYVESCTGGQVYSVDIDPAATDYARSVTGKKTHVETADSIAYLQDLATRLLQQGRSPDLVYLDSFDFDAENPIPSGVHHLKEFCALKQCLGPNTLVVIDDSPKLLTGWMIAPEQLAIGGFIGESGKGKFLIAYLRATGAEAIFEEYQIGFLLGKAAGRP